MHPGSDSVMTQIKQVRLCLEGNDWRFTSASHLNI